MQVTPIVIVKREECRIYTWVLVWVRRKLPFNRRCSGANPHSNPLAGSRPDEVGSDAIPDAAGGEGGHGAAKPDRVIHRYVFYRKNDPLNWGLVM
jgi:hypothetical protein